MAAEGLAVVVYLSPVLRWGEYFVANLSNLRTLALSLSANLTLGYAVGVMVMYVPVALSLSANLTLGRELLHGRLRPVGAGIVSTPTRTRTRTPTPDSTTTLLLPTPLLL